MTIRRYYYSKEQDERKKHMERIRDDKELKENDSFTLSYTHEMYDIVSISILWAMELRANLLIEVNKEKCSVVFAGNKLYITRSYQNEIIELIKRANEVIFCTTQDTGFGEPTDLEDAVQLELYYDLVREVLLPERDNAVK